MPEPSPSRAPQQEMSSSNSNPLLGEEFDSSVLDTLIEESLSDKKPAEPVKISPLFSFGDTRLIKKLDSILQEYLPPEQSILVLDGLREELYSGLRSRSIQDLHSLVLNTKTSTGVKPSLPSWNIKNPDIVFVNYGLPTGRENDTSFVKALKDSNFSSSFCSWTSVIRYDVNPDEIEEDELEKWHGILFSELRIWRPKLIIPVGALASSVFLGSNAKLADRQGVVHWVGPWAIMPIYSYIYAIKSNKLDAFNQGLMQAHKYCFGET